MAEKHHKEWDRRYREEDRVLIEDPSDFLMKWESDLPSGKALDVGCGAGRNALFLTSKGYTVDAIDYSEEGLKIARERSSERNLEVNWIHEDVNQYNFPPETYDVIIITFFHPQNKLQEIKNSLKKEGFFLYEHHISTKEPVEKGPKNSRFRFEPNEFLEIFSDFQILDYEEGIEKYESGDRSAIARIVARKTDEYGKELPTISNKLEIRTE